MSEIWPNNLRFFHCGFPLIYKDSFEKELNNSQSKMKFPAAIHKARLMTKLLYSCCQEKLMLNLKIGSSIKRQKGKC